MKRSIPSKKKAQGQGVNSRALRGRELGCWEEGGQKRTFDDREMSRKGEGASYHGLWGDQKVQFNTRM